MKTPKLLLWSLVAIASLSIVTAKPDVSFAQSEKRMSIVEIRSSVEVTRKKMLQERSIEARRKILLDLVTLLSAEQDKGAAFFDETFLEVSSFYTDLDSLANVPCAQSKEAFASYGLPAGTQGPTPEQRKYHQYRLQMHSAFCRKD